MKAKRVPFVIVGITQGAMGVAAIVLTCILYFNFSDVQTILNVPTELVSLCLLVLAMFGFFSIVSGSFLLRRD